MFAQYRFRTFAHSDKKAAQLFVEDHARNELVGNSGDGIVAAEALIKRCSRALSGRLVAEGRECAAGDSECDAQSSDHGSILRLSVQANVLENRRGATTIAAPLIVSRGWRSGPRDRHRDVPLSGLIRRQTATR